jgi:hypothetical protein
MDVHPLTCDINVDQLAVCEKNGPAGVPPLIHAGVSLTTLMSLYTIRNVGNGAAQLD